MSTTDSPPQAATWWRRWVRASDSYLRELASPPEPLRRGEKILLALLFIVVAISRVFALSQSQLDWDESLFSCGVREYDVYLQHPHPPGYPLFILAAKIARLLVRDDFRALQSVVTTASLLLFPAAFMLGRELRLRFRVAAAAAAVTVFMPTVWYYGGTALSDVPALCGVIAASALLLAGARNPRFWIAGMFILALTAGIRPQHIIIAAVPALLGAAAHRHRRAMAAGCLLFAAVVAAAYAGAAFASSDPPHGYLEQVLGTIHHIGSVDSYRNGGRPPLRQLASMFFVSSHRGGRSGQILLALMVFGVLEALVRRRLAIVIVLAMFIPTAILNWMMLDTTAITRYGLAYVMLFSIVAVYALDRGFSVVPSFAVQSALLSIAATIVVVALIRWTWPALDLVRHQPSPPVAAMRWVRANVPRRGPQLYLDDLLGYHAAYQLAGYDTRFFSNYGQIPPTAYIAGNYCMTNTITVQPHARLYRFPRKRLADIARGSYFEVSLIPMNAMVRFGEGWYQEEYGSEHAWRWMGRTSTTLFPLLPTAGVLALHLHFPLDTIDGVPTLTISWNGTVIERRICRTADLDLRYQLPSRSDQPDELLISVDRAAHPIEKGLTTDPREFGVQLTSVSWERADGLPYAR